MSHAILTDDRLAGLYHLPANRHPDLGATGHPLFTVDVARCRDLGETLREFGQALHLPDWYGANLDALHDCLSDPEWQAERPAILLVRGLEILRHSDPEALSSLIEVLRSAAELRAAQGHPLWILLGTPVRGIATLPGA